MQQDDPDEIIRVGQASLFMTTTSRYSFVGQSMLVSSASVFIYRPTPDRSADGSDYFILGDHAQYGSNVACPMGASYVVRVPKDKDDDANPLIKPPIGYQLVSIVSGVDNLIEFWYPMPPDGYLSIGCVATPYISGFPSIKYGCLRRDLVEQTKAGPMIWSNKNHNSTLFLALYSIEGVPNSFVMQTNYDPYCGAAYKLK